MNSIGVDFKLKSIQLDDKNVKLQIVSLSKEPLNGFNGFNSFNSYIVPFAFCIFSFIFIEILTFYFSGIQPVKKDSALSLPAITKELKLLL